MTRRNRGVSPLTALGLTAGAFVAGILTERSAKVTHKVEAKTAEQKAKLQELTRKAVTAAQQEVQATSEAFGRELAKAQEAIQGKTEPKWSDWESSETDDGTFHSGRIMKGRPYVMTAVERTIGGHAVETYMVAYQKSPKSNVWPSLKGGPLYGAWESADEAAKAAEKHAGIGKARRNTGRIGYTARDAQKEALDAFFEHSRIHRKAFEQGIVQLVFYHWPSQRAFKRGTKAAGPFDAADVLSWGDVKPHSIVELFVADPNDPDAKLSEKDTLALLIEGN